MKTDEPRWLDDTQQRTWRGFVEVHALLTARLNRQLQQHAGLSLADYEVLVALSEAEGGRLRGFELSEAVQWERSRLSHHLSRMERRGLVTREGCDTDRRGAFAVLTPEGRRVIEAAAPEHVEDVRRWFVDVLTPEQLEALTEIDDALRAALHASG